MSGILKGLWFTVTGVAPAGGASKSIQQLLPGSSRVVTLTCLGRQKWKWLEECHQRGGHGLTSKPGTGCWAGIPELGTRCWAGTQHPPAPSPSEAHKELAIGLAVLQSMNIKRKKKSNFRTALRARVFYTIFLFLSSSLCIRHPGWDCNWRRVMAAVTRPGWPWSGSAASCRICIPSPKSALRGYVW